MGTRYEDQPAEHWAGAESLDPTPVWKQYLLIALLLFAGLIAVLVVALLAIAPLVVAPPALVPGDRLVLPIADLPTVGRSPNRIEPSVSDGSRAFYLARPTQGEEFAFRAYWAPTVGDRECPVDIATLTAGSAVEFGYIARCENVFGRVFVFTSRGAAREGGYRGLDQYLVSMSDDRVIVNLSRVIQPSERTGGPVPTGIPQPQAP
ncbi:MAG TPA: hypothetical protein VJP45_02400 [Candidatus Limnocylindria bacterium]|nr:hypothetical protein [Candidatus Limnocylindria bacterium]